jgi:hypothetical protein
MNQKSIIVYIVTKQTSGCKVNDVRFKRHSECRSDHFFLLASVLAKNPYKVMTKTEYEEQSKKKRKEI